LVRLFEVLGFVTYPAAEMPADVDSTVAASDQGKKVGGSDEVVKKTSVLTAKPNATMFGSIAVSMVGAMMFGLDQGNFGQVQAFDTFRDFWCVGHFDNGDPGTCAGEEAAKNYDWEHAFVLPGATLITFGAALGALALAPRLARDKGRIPCVSAGGFLTFLGCVFSSYASFGNIWVFYIARFITGVGVGVACFALPLYNAEVSVPSIRGATGSLFQLNVAVGGFVASLFTYYCDDWKIGIMLPGAAGIFLTAACFFLPESPRFVMERHGYEKGLETLMKVRSGQVKDEADEIMAQIREEEGVEEVSYGQMWSEPNLRRRVTVACGLVLAQQLTGVNAFLGYSATVFEAAGLPPFKFNCIFTGEMILACIVGLLMIDSPFGGRKIQLLLASVIMGPPLMLAAAALAFDWSKMLVTICVLVYGAGFQLAWGMIPWIYPAEIFTMSEKEKSVSLAVTLNYLANAAVVFGMPFLMDASVPVTFVFFGVLNILNFLYVMSAVKETKGVPLEAVPALFGKKKDGAGKRVSEDSKC
jgi:sugar porter (SP) family MFS transporter